MSRYKPSAIAAADQDIALPPYFGGEFAAYASHVPAKRMADILITGSNTGSLTANAALALTAGGVDLQVVAVNYLKSYVAAVITLGVTNNLNNATTAVATFRPVERAVDQSFNFPRGIAQDLVPAAGATIKAINSLASIVGGQPNGKFAVYELPRWPEDYFLIGCTTSKNFNTKGRTAKGIDCGMETDAFVKRGKTRPANLTISQKLFGWGDGLSRLDGGKVTIMLRGIKDGLVTNDVLVFTEWVPSFSNELPDGDGEAMINSDEGKYGELLMFVAEDE